MAIVSLVVVAALFLLWYVVLPTLWWLFWLTAIAVGGFAAIRYLARDRRDVP